MEVSWVRSPHTADHFQANVTSTCLLKASVDCKNQQTKEMLPTPDSISERIPTSIEFLLVLILYLNQIFRP